MLTFEDMNSTSASEVRDLETRVAEPSLQLLARAVLSPEEPARRAFKVCEDKPSAGSKCAMDFAENGELLLVGYVMQHQSREDLVKTGVRERDGFGAGLVES